MNRKELVPQYVLEGSVRKAGERLRISAQLVETATGNHIWAERYDRDLTDVFDVHDEITTRIVAALEPAIMAFETHAALAKAPNSMQAWDHLLRGLWHISHEANPQLAPDILHVDCCAQVDAPTRHSSWAVVARRGVDRQEAGSGVVRPVRSHDIENGRLVNVVGQAPPEPPEFVVLLGISACGVGLAMDATKVEACAG